ncbi:alpha/beta hydrolase fold protein [Sulfobacillus acidophilus TPY]|uniref:2-hydroxymuconate semialdehyde hydrolase n=1 Tax=Sulfobacillus acidophilus (strain ATCC 700253 / DSM 10332 / NAL) TaxID=679936 RepID=G8U0B2_SULAD|nr:alpha/beta hydrolase fold protein [Sulfobacillus acidophilus TPY]AEW06454.1 2-hydroxymuconate semialdehyde hydrolase [Sulfobacillus acidophilus DSM 10332]
MSELTGQWIQTGHFRTYYHDVGQGDPVVFIHGSGPGVSAQANWARILPPMSERFRALALDIVGFGQTERPAGMVPRLAEWVDHVVAFLDALDIPRAHLVGNSMGGGVALNLAARFPERVNKMVLMGSMGIPFPLTDGLAKVWGYRGTSLDEMREVMLTFAYDKGLINDDLVALRYRRSLEPVSKASYEAMFDFPLERHIAGMSTPEELIRRIDVPTLLIHGRDDQVIPPENSWRLMGLLPRADVHMFSRCGHWTQIERESDFIAVVRQFLEGSGR